jgi:hypothetical protein
MAKRTWAPEFPIDFSAYGDRTFEAVLKGCINEIDNVYEHLNYLQDNSTRFASIVPVGTTATLPASATPGDIWVVPGSPIKVYAWTGTTWRELTLTPPDAATTETPGTVQLGTLVDALGSTPSGTKVINETVLRSYLESGSTGVPVGGIVVWRDTVATIPAGWVYCDGENGTPDLRGMFVSGKAIPGEASVVTGEDTVEIPPTTLLPHDHTFTSSTVVPQHEHPLDLVSDNNLVQHTHSLTIGDASSTVAGGAHEHRADLDVMVRDGTESRWRGGGGAEDPTTWSYGTEGFTNPAYHYHEGYLLPSGEHVHNVTGIAIISDATLGHEHTVAGASQEAGAATVVFMGDTDVTQVDITVVKDSRPKFKEVIFIMKVQAI